MENKHLSGLQADLNKQIKQNKRTGGPSSALKRIKKRPSGNYHANARVGAGMIYHQCDKCGKTAEYRSVVNGEVEYSLCADCYNKRNKKKW